MSCWTWTTNSSIVSIHAHTVPKVKVDQSLCVWFARPFLPGNVIVSPAVSAMDSMPSASRPLSPLDKGLGVLVCTLASWLDSTQRKIHYGWSQGTECKPDPTTTPTGVCAQWTIMMSLEAPAHEFMGYFPSSPLPSVPWCYSMVFRWS